MHLSRSLIAAVAVLAGAGCTHPDSFAPPVSPVYGPFSSGPTVQISFNTDQDYWPAWTDDGRGILYAFVDGEGAAAPKHRCIGLLPAAGGSRIWQLCDNRAVRDDTVSSYGGYAPCRDGKLLVAEAIVPADVPYEPLPRISLWLADTAKPYVRTTLLTLPQTVDGFGVTWLADITWTGPNTFLALGQQLGTLAHGDNSLVRDSIFSDAGMVITGTISSGSATLHTIAGTDSATSYSLAENGASIVFTRHHDLHLFKVPVGGGTPMPPPVQRTIPDTAAYVMGELAGVSCMGSTCIGERRDLPDLTDAYTPRAGAVLYARSLRASCRSC